MATWVFVRHGQSEANRDGWFAGQVDAPLTPLGIAQAEEARERLADFTFQRAVCSDLSRARATAKIIVDGSGLRLVQTAALRERSVGEWARRTIQDVVGAGDLDHHFKPWRGVPPGGESLEQVALRATRWLATLDGDLDTIVVSHGALMRAVLGALDGRPRERIDEWHPTNCEHVVRQVTPGTWGRLHTELVEAAGLV